MKKTFLKVGLTAAILSSIALGVWAEEAPVYDVDNFPPQFDGQDNTAIAPGAKPQNPSAALPAASSSSSLGDAQVMPSTESMSMPQRIARIEQQVNNMLHEDVGVKVADMQTQIQALRGQVEQLSHELQEMQLQQKKMYSDLDRRLSQKSGTPNAAPSPTAAEEPAAAAADLSSSDTPSLEPADTIKSKAKGKSKSTSSVSASAKSDAAAPNDAEEQKIYQNAYNLIKSKKYNEAAAAFQDMLQKYPSGPSAANAHYWLGELYGLMGKNDQASTEFNTLVKTYPDSPKVADAQLKLGLIYAAQFKWPDAKTSFKKVMSRYPGTASARLASEQLKQIKVAGH